MTEIEMYHSGWLGLPAKLTKEGCRPASATAIWLGARMCAQPSPGAGLRSSAGSSSVVLCDEGEPIAEMVHGSRVASQQSRREVLLAPSYHELVVVSGERSRSNHETDI